MKQTILSFLLALLPLAASADAVEIDGIYYNLVNKAKTAEVTNNPNKYKGTVTIPKTVTYNDVTYNVTSIGGSAFYNCGSLTSVTIPNSVTSIGGGAFSVCSGLTSIIIPNSVTSIGHSAFYKCSGLTSITIPNSVISIGDWAFGYSGLTSIAIPNSVTSIRDYAFYECKSLTSITIPNSMTSIGNYVFDGCSGLTSIVIPNSVTSIGEGAFNGCSGLSSIIIGSGIKTIDGYAFSRCPELTDVYCYAKSVPSTYSGAFSDSYIEYATLHVPVSTLEAYKATAPWSSFKNFVSLEGGDQLYDMTVSVGSAMGKVTYGTTDVTNGQQTFNVRGSENVVLTLTPNDGFKVNQVTVNGENKIASVVNGTLTLGNLSANTMVSVSFSVAGEFTKVVIGSDKMATFCPLADADLSTLNLKAYIGSGFNRQTGVLTLTRVYDVPAGEGLLLKGEPGTYFVPYSKSYSVYSNLLKGVITATNLNATEGSYVNYVLSSGSQGVGFYKVGTAGASLEAEHAYLQIPAETATSRNALKLRFDDEEEATAISDVERQEGEAAVYDLQGRRVAQPQRGIYIRGGKKVIVK